MCKETSAKSVHSYRHPLLHGALLALSLGGAPASANVITLDLTADIFAGTITSIVDVNGFTGERWYSAPLGFSPITIDEGDQLDLNIQFSAGQRMELASGSFASGLENIGFRKTPLPGISLQGSSTLTSLSGLAGDLDIALPTTNNFSTVGQLSGTIFKDMTDTAFSYTGYGLSTTYTALSGGPVTISSLDLYAAAADITLSRTAIPEPASLLLMSIGLAGMGFSLRRS